jgi:acyl-CoA thioesterase I
MYSAAKNSCKRRPPRASWAGPGPTAQAQAVPLRKGKPVEKGLGLAVAALVAWVCGTMAMESRGAATAEAGGKIKVACVGDSITAGAGAGPKEAYPAVLGKLLGEKYEVGNFGCSGATLMKKGDKPYWKVDQFTKSDAFAPDIVVIMLGTNDTKKQNLPHVDEFTADYKDLVAHYRALPSKPQVYVVAIPPITKPSFNMVPEASGGQIVPLIRKVAEENKTPLVDVFAAFKDHAAEYLTGDGCHPNPAGHAAIAKAVAEAITKPAPAKP